MPNAQGANDFLALSKRLKQVGEKEMRAELHNAMKRAARPLAQKVRAGSAERIGAHSGGIEKPYGKKPVNPAVRTGNQNAGVRLVMPKTDQRVDAEGRVAHPIFGRKGKAANKGKNYVAQTMPNVKGFFTEAASESSEEVAQEILNIIRDYTIRALKMGL